MIVVVGGGEGSWMLVRGRGRMDGNGYYETEALPWTWWLKSTGKGTIPIDTYLDVEV